MAQLGRDLRAVSAASSAKVTARRTAASPLISSVPTQTERHHGSREERGDHRDDQGGAIALEHRLRCRVAGDHRARPPLVSALSAS